ncbi:hypothetical protein GCM10020331_061850 [Ectobacillus funiculus]
MTAIENDWNIIQPFTDYGPIVLCNEYVNHADVPIIRLDQYKGTYIGVKHLIEKKGIKNCLLHRGDCLTSRGKIKIAIMVIKKSIKKKQGL